MGDAVWDKRAPHRTSPPVAPVPVTGTNRVIRVTQDSDGQFAPRMMSDRANAWISGGEALVFAGSRDTGGPRFFAVDLSSEQVTRRDDLICPYQGETEFWYWTPDGKLMIGAGLQLHRVDPRNGSDDVVMDASFIPGAHMIDQWHSSDDGNTHSATVKDEGYQKVGTATMHSGKLDYWPAMRVLDESQVSRDGHHVVIKENDDNRIINLDTRETVWLRDHDRALGHSDCGPDFIIGEADKPDPGACIIRYFDKLHASPVILFNTTNMGYVSTRGGRCLHSDDIYLSLVALDGSGTTPLVEHGANTHPGDPDYYDLRVKTNLDHTGQVGCYMIRGRIFLIRL